MLNLTKLLPILLATLLTTCCGCSLQVSVRPTFQSEDVPATVEKPAATTAPTS
jgi:hypothetical protein